MGAKVNKKRKKSLSNLYGIGVFVHNNSNCGSHKAVLESVRGTPDSTTRTTAAQNIVNSSSSSPEREKSYHRKMIL
jgi:hypothetical protein